MKLTVRKEALIVVLTLFISLFFVMGGSAFTVGLFFPPLIKTFHWSHARLSFMYTAFALAMGLSSPFAGWLIEPVHVWLAACNAGVAGSGGGASGAMRLPNDSARSARTVLSTARLAGRLSCAATASRHASRTRSRLRRTGSRLRGSALLARRELNRRWVLMRRLRVAICQEHKPESRPPARRRAR